jgi:hypothetical protein
MGWLFVMESGLWPRKIAQRRSRGAGQACDLRSNGGVQPPSKLSFSANGRKYRKFAICAATVAFSHRANFAFRPAAENIGLTRNPQTTAICKSPNRGGFLFMLRPMAAKNRPAA